jgi:amino acid transporter
VAIAGVNIISAKFATQVAIVFMVAKLSAMAIMIGVGIYNISNGEWGALDLNGTTWDAGDATIGDIAASFYSGGWYELNDFLKFSQQAVAHYELLLDAFRAYDGWNNLNFAMEELSDPYRNLPLSIIIGIPLVTVLYLLISVSYLTAFTTKQGLEASSAVAIDVGNKYLGVMKWIVPVMVSLSAIGTANGSMFTAGR